jgi:hypothetical protein
LCLKKIKNNNVLCKAFDSQNQVMNDLQLAAPNL